MHVQGNPYMTMLHVINNARFFFFCHSQIILMNNLAFSLDCATLWLEMANGAFHTALSTKVTMWWFPMSFLTLTFITSKAKNTNFYNFKAIGFRWPPQITHNCWQLYSIVNTNHFKLGKFHWNKMPKKWWLLGNFLPPSLSLSLFSIFLGGLKHVWGGGMEILLHTHKEP